MTDLGAGVHQHDDEPPVNGRVGPVAPRDKLTCPHCGLHDRAGRIQHPEFSFFCACGGLFNATDIEWEQLRKRREQVKARREAGVPVPPLALRSHKVEHHVPVQQRIAEHEENE